MISWPLLTLSTAANVAATPELLTIDYLDPWVGGGDDQPGFLGQFPGHGPTPTRRGADLQQCGHLLQGALDRAGFRRLAGYVRPSDTRTVSELYRLCRDLADILAVRGWCQQHQVKLHVLAGSLSGITDLAATDTTTTMLVSVGQFQRDLQHELTREVLAVAWAEGSTSGGLPRLVQLGVTNQIRQAYRTGASIAALAREHGISRGAIRTAVADLLPDQPHPPAPP